MSEITPKSSWVRFPAAIVVAFVASVATEVIFAIFDLLTHITSDSYPVLSVVLAAFSNFVVGLCGVFFGALCLRASERGSGAVVLLALGISFEFFIFGSAHGEFHFPRGVIATGIGGLMAVALCYWRTPPNKSPEPTAVGAVSSADAVYVPRRRWLSFFR
jgi:hypothetical protein